MVWKQMGRVMVLVAIGSVVAGTARAQHTDDVFQRVFGVSKTLDPDTVAKVVALPPGERLSVDRDGEGVIDELWYLDTAKRHTKSPLLVRVIDEDGDLADTERGDRDSDLYLWDWGADGTVDVATDYQDNDRDNDVDEMGIFYKKNWKDDLDDITVWWGVDVGDDNQLWYDIDGTYYQGPCQYRTHFSGNETFYQFRLTEHDDAWLNVFEDPFAFYDPDGDTCSEVVVRVCARGHDVENLRYSIDADGDAHGSRTHDYEFSITAIPGDMSMTTENAVTAPMQIRGIPTHPVLAWNDAKAFAKSAPWGKAMLTWDELNANTEGDVDRDSHERWEGVINRKSRHDDFPQVGGPPVSAFNKRVEVSHRPALPLRLYFDTADRRLHLMGAAYGYLDVDYNHDGAADAVYEYVDTDGDGILDRRTIDFDADGTGDVAWPMSGVAEEVDLEYEPISALYRSTLAEVLDESQRFIDTAKAILGEPVPAADAIESFFVDDLLNWHLEREVGLHVRTTAGGARYYLDLVRDQLFYALKERFGESPQWEPVERAYAAGRLSEAETVLHTSFLKGQMQPVVPGYLTFTKRIAIEVDNEGHSERERWPIVLSLPALRAAAADFNAANCAVVASERWIHWFEVPHQVDVLDDAAGAELNFVADLPADGKRTFYLFYSPEGARETAFPRLTGAVLDTPAYVAWESDAGAFRFYTGQFDFFGKQADRGLPRAERLLYPIVGENYHAEQDWGIDALHVGETSGLGGLTLYRDGKPYLVQSPAGQGDVVFNHRVLFAGPVRAAVEITAENIIPGEAGISAIYHCIIYAGHPESEIRARIKGISEPFDLAPGLIKLDNETWFVDEEQGVLGNWGWQEEGIGEVALSVVVPPDRFKELVELDHERRLRCAASEGALRYWIIGDWRRGRQYPVSPTIENWRREMLERADLLNHEPAVRIGPVEKISKPG